MTLKNTLGSHGRQPDTTRIGPARSIRHGFLMPSTVRTLTVPMIQTTFGALLVATVRCPALRATTYTAAPIAAVPLSAVTGTTEVENRVTTRMPANSLPQNHFRQRCHPLFGDTGQRTRFVGAWAYFLGTVLLFPGSLQLPRPL